MRKTIVLLTTMLISTTVFGQEGKDLLEGTTEEQYIPKVIIEAKWGKEMEEFGLLDGKGREPSRGPSAITLDRENNIFILDGVNKRIVKYTNGGKYLKTIDLEQRKIKIKRKNPIWLFANKNPKWFKEMYNKLPEDIPEYEEQEIDAVWFYSNRGDEIQVDSKENIYFLIGIPQFLESYALVIYNKNGKIVRGYSTRELSDQQIEYGSDLEIKNLNIDKEGNLNFIKTNLIAKRKMEKDKQLDWYATTIDSKGRIKSVNLEKLDEKTRYEKFGISHPEIYLRNFPSSLKLKAEIKKMVDQCRIYYSMRPATDDKGNIYELVWCDGFLDKGVKIIKWEKVK